MLTRRLTQASVLSLFLVALIAACGDDIAPANGVATVDAGKKKPPKDKSDDDDGDDDDDDGGDDDTESDSGTTDGGKDATVKDASTDGSGNLSDGGTSCSVSSSCALTLDPAPGKTSEAVFSQGTDVLDRPSQPAANDEYGPCYSQSVTQVRTYYAYVEVKNPGNSPVAVDVRIDTPPGGAVIASLLSAYAKVPSTVAERNACLTGVNMKCPEATGTGSKWPCLVGAKAPTVPANGSIWIYLALNSPPAQPAGAIPARFVVRATVK